MGADPIPDIRIAIDYIQRSVAVSDADGMSSRTMTTLTSRVYFVVIQHRMKLVLEESFVGFIGCCFDSFREGLKQSLEI